LLSGCPGARGRGGASDDAVGDEPLQGGGSGKAEQPGDGDAAVGDHHLVAGTDPVEEFRQYVQQAAASSPASTADQLARLAGLRDRGSSPPTSSSGEKAKVPAAPTAGLPGPYGRLDQTAQGNREPAAL
jgi:hypothetical protein